jgi:two-component system, chemotaxis family, chemotaxis protein CheY
MPNHLVTQNGDNCFMESDVKILIADDIAVMRGILKNVLREYYYENVEEASNGVEALQKFRLNKFDLVMLDINMPIKDGVTVLKEIREIDPVVFIVMISADSSAENIKSALALGVNGFVVKPFSAAKINGIMQKFKTHLLALKS